MKALNAQFELLVSRHLEGRLSADDESALRVRLHDDAMARARFVELMDLHALLAGDAALAGNVLADADREPPKVVTFPSKYRRVIFGMAAAAAIVLLAATVWMLGRPQVLLLRGVGQEFANASSLPHGELIGQSVDLKQGLLELSFRTADATVVIEAPAKFRIEDAKTLRMESGRVTAHVRDGKQGLRVLTPHTDVLDLGTRFAVDVSDGRRSEVHVFEGKVEAGATGAEHRDLLTTNQALRFATSAKPEVREVRSGTFVQPEEMKSLAAGAKAGQARRALGADAKLKQDAALIGWVGFEQSSGEAAVEVHGARRVQGRFTGQQALEFVDTDDHAKMNLHATTRQLTLMTWVRLDRVPDGISSLYHTDGWNTPGQVHWMILNNGQMRFAMSGAPLSGDQGGVQWPQSRDPVLGQLGRWLHLAAVYDADTQQVSLFTNGKFDSSVEMKTGLPAVLGPAQIGNWNVKHAHGTEHRRLSGRMDELIALSRCLSADEIRQHYEAGNPYR
jgi:hypothetical protein